MQGDEKEERTGSGRQHHCCVNAHRPQDAQKDGVAAHRDKRIKKGVDGIGGHKEHHDERTQ